MLIATIGALLIGAGAMILSLRILLAPNGKEDADVPITVTADRGETNPEARIQSLLQRAKDDIDALRLTTPAANNAYDKYQTVLSLDPANTEAQGGIRKVAVRYLQLARDAAREKDWPKLLSFLDSARMVDPDNDEITRAEKRLRALIGEKIGRRRDR